jgi:hypothetical protein
MLEPPRRKRNGQASASAGDFMLRRCPLHPHCIGEISFAAYVTLVTVAAAFRDARHASEWGFAS